MPSMRRLGAAVANNASWCDAVCRSHDHPGTFGPSLWSSTGHQGVHFGQNARRPLAHRLALGSKR
ncbi:MAG TPA: hypothetical protein VMU95_16960 [Trebonia sp.]|nr:hypothetical protein [Trebonia sp.]